MKCLSQAKLGSWNIAMKPFWFAGMKLLSEAKLKNHHETILLAGMKFPSQAKLKNRHETVLVAGMKFLSQAKLGSWNIAMKPFWLLE
jgi:hypothetical protein